MSDTSRLGKHIQRVRPLHVMDAGTTNEAHHARPSGPSAGTWVQTPQWGQMEPSFGDEVVDSEVRRTREHKPQDLNLWQAYIHKIKGNVGPGCLSMPYIFSEGGLIPSLVILLLFAPACIYGMLLLVWSKHKMIAILGPSAARRTINFEQV